MEIIQHFSHPEHSLILNKVSENDNSGETEEEFVCYGCPNPITKKDDYYTCKTNLCNFFLHKECANLPREINLPMHEHPLILHPRPPYKPPSCICNICLRSNWKWFTYNCSICEYDVDAICISFLQPGKNNILQHDGHPHPLTLQLRPLIINCDACGTKKEDLVYICTTCPFWIHKTCVSVPKSIEVVHDPLFLAFSLPQKHRNFTQFCDICQKKVHPIHWVYCCDNCRYFNHLKCATAKPQLVQAEEGDTESNHDLLMQYPLSYHVSQDPVSLLVKNCNSSRAYNNGESKLFHRLHDHPLSIHNDDDTTIEILCDGCARPISLPYYNCRECKLFLHRCCVELPEERLCCPYDPKHSLKVKKVECYDYFRCAFCLRYCNGFSCQCESCDLKMDVGCASYIPKRIKHESHEHPLVRNKASEGKYKVRCKGCSMFVRNNGSGIIFGCKACSFNLCIICVNYSGSVRHEYDSHSIPLTYPPIKDHPSDFICEICEDINPRYWMYHCQDCNQSFHTRCIDPPTDLYSTIKFGGTVNFNNVHQHPLTFVRNIESKYESLCDQCGLDKNGIPVHECELCSIKICRQCVSKIEGTKLSFED